MAVLGFTTLPDLIHQQDPNRRTPETRLFDPSLTFVRLSVRAMREPKYADKKTIKSHENVIIFRVFVGSGGATVLKLGANGRTDNRGQTD